MGMSPKVGVASKNFTRILVTKKNLFSILDHHYISLHMAAKDCILHSHFYWDHLFAVLRT